MRDFKTTTRSSSAAYRYRWLGAALVVLCVLAFLAMRTEDFPALKERSASVVGVGTKDSAGPVTAPEAEHVASRAEAGQIAFGGSQEERLNVLVLGVDKRPDGYAVEGARADTIMLAQVEPGTGRIRLLSIPRDLQVDIGSGQEDRINAAYAYGGVSRTIDVVEDYTGLPVDHYAVVDFEGFEDVIDAMGGLEIDVEGEFPPGWQMEEGIQTLDGRHALFYARYRGTPGGDLDRMERQQQVVAALRSQALRWQSVTKLPQISRAIYDNVETDVGFGEGISLGRALMRQGRSAQMTAVQLKGTPVTRSDGAEVLEPDEKENELILQDFRE